MKNLVVFLAIFCAGVISAQIGTLYIFNYSAYSADITIFGTNQNNTNNNCFPHVESAGLLTIPAGQSEAYNGYSNSQANSFPINGWYYRFTTTPPSPAYSVASSPIFNATGPLASNTQWSGAKFNVNQPNGGFTIGYGGCGVNSSFTDYVGGPPGSGFPVEANWFSIGNDWYFIIQ